MKLRYLIGLDYSRGETFCYTELGYDAEKPPSLGQGIKYCNLFDEKNTGSLGPYLHTSDTAQEYHEGQIDPSGRGWGLNINDQLNRALRQGFEVVEWDNCDAYPLSEIILVYDLTLRRGLHVVAKNPALIEGTAMNLLTHPAVVGCVVEEGAGTCDGMHRMRLAASKPNLPIWFVAFGIGLRWAHARARTIRYRGYKNMSVTYSGRGEYESSIDIQEPLE